MSMFLRTSFLPSFLSSFLLSFHSVFTPFLPPSEQHQGYLILISSLCI
jgi:hypothetical protein